MEDEGMSTCDNCRRLKAQIEMNRATLALNFSTLRRKLIISDFLTRDNAARTQEYNAQTKKLEDATQLVEQLQRDCVKYESELSRVLQEVEPLREERSTLITSNKTISAQLDTLQENLSAAKKMEEQYSLMIKDHHKNESQFQAKITSLKQKSSKLNKELSQLKKQKEEAQDWRNEHNCISKTLTQTRKKFVKCIKHLMTFGNSLQCHELLTKRDKRVLGRYAAQTSSISSGDSQDGSQSDSECDTDGQLMERMILHNENASENMPTAKKMVDVAVSVNLLPLSKLNSEMLIDLLDSCIYEASLLTPLPPSPKFVKNCKLSKNDDNPALSAKNRHSEISKPTKKLSDCIDIYSHPLPTLEHQVLESNQNIHLNSNECLTIQQDGSSSFRNSSVSNENNDLHKMAANLNGKIPAEKFTPAVRDDSSTDTHENMDKAVPSESSSIVPASSSSGAAIVGSCSQSSDFEICSKVNDENFPENALSDECIPAVAYAESPVHRDGLSSVTSGLGQQEQSAISENFDRSCMFFQNAAGCDFLLEEAKEINEAEAEGTSACPLSVLNDVIANEHSYSCISIDATSASDNGSSKYMKDDLPKNVANEVLTLGNDNVDADKDDNVNIPSNENLLEKPSEDVTSDATDEKQGTNSGDNSNNGAFASSPGTNSLSSEEDNDAINSSCPNYLSANNPVSEIPTGKVVNKQQDRLLEADNLVPALEQSDASMAMQCSQSDMSVPNVYSCNNISQIANELGSNESIGVNKPSTPLLNISNRTDSNNTDEVKIAVKSKTRATHTDFSPEAATTSQEKEQLEISGTSPSEKSDLTSSYDVGESRENDQSTVITNPELSISTVNAANRKLDKIQSTKNSCEFISISPITRYNRPMTTASLESEQRVVQGCSIENVQNSQSLQSSSVESGINSHLPKYLVRNCQPAQCHKTVQFFKLGKTAPSNWDENLKLYHIEKHPDRVNFLKKGSFLKDVASVERGNGRSPTQYIENAKEKCLITDRPNSTVFNHTVSESNAVDNNLLTANWTHFGHTSSVPGCSHNCKCSYDENAILALRPIFIRALLGENKCHQCCQTPVVEHGIRCAHKSTPTNVPQTAISHLENIRTSPTSPTNDNSKSIKPSLPTVSGEVETSEEKVAVVARSRDVTKNKTDNLSSPNVSFCLQQVKSKIKSIDLTADPSPPDDISRSTNSPLICNKSDFSQGSVDASDLQNNLLQCNKASFPVVSMSKCKKAKKKSLRERLLVSMKHPNRNDLKLQRPAQLTVKSKLTKSKFDTYSEVTKQQLQGMLNDLILSEEHKRPLSPIPCQAFHNSKNQKVALSKSVDEIKIRTYARRVSTRKRSAAACLQEVPKEINVTPGNEGTCNIKSPTPVRSSKDCPPVKKLKNSDGSIMEEMPSCERRSNLSEDVLEDATIDTDMKEDSDLRSTTSLLLPNGSNLYSMECARPATRNSKIGSRIIDNIVQLLTPLPPLPPDGHSHIWNSVISRLCTSLSAKQLPLLSKKLSSWMLTCTTDPLLVIVTSKYAKPEDERTFEINLSDTEKKCLYLVQKLRAKDKMEKIEEEMTIQSMKSILSNDATTLGRASLCRFYVSLCKLQKNIEKARIFCHDIIYHVRKICGPLLVNAIGVWPEIVHCESDGNSSLLMVFLFTLNKKNAAIGCTKEFSIQKFLSSWYNLDIPTRDPKELTNLIVEQLKTGEQNESFESMKALELLGRVEGWKWANNFLIREVLWPILQMWCQQASGDSKKITDNAMANCLFLLGCLTKQCPAANKASAVEVLITMHALLEKSLTVPFAWCIQEAAVLVTLMLLPYDKEVGTTASKNWILKHKEQISGALKETLIRAQLMPSSDSS